MTEVWILVILFSCFTDNRAPKLGVVVSGVVFTTKEACEAMRSHEQEKLNEECRKYGVLNRY